jgi:hypothetical protein
MAPPTHSEYPTSTSTSTLTSFVDSAKFARNQQGEAVCVASTTTWAGVAFNGTSLDYKMQCEFTRNPLHEMGFGRPIVRRTQPTTTTRANKSPVYGSKRNRGDGDKKRNQRSLSGWDDDDDVSGCVCNVLGCTYDAEEYNGVCQDCDIVAKYMRALATGEVCLCLSRGDHALTRDNNDIYDLAYKWWTCDGNMNGYGHEKNCYYHDSDYEHLDHIAYLESLLADSDNDY